MNNSLVNDEWQPKPIPESVTKPLDPLVKGWIEEVRKILPGVPDDLAYEWDNNQMMGGYACGGATITPNLIHLSFDPDFEDKETQLENLKATVYHELFHTAQGWALFESKQPDATDMVSQAIMEGAACVFEHESGNDPVYASPEDGEVPEAMLEELKALPKELDWEQWHKWKFYDPETDRKWIVYKAGYWFINQMLSKNPNLKIQDLAPMTPLEILALS